MNPINTSGISPSPRVETDRKTGGSATGTTSEAASAQGRGGSEDTVELTDTATRLSQLAQELSAADGVDLQRVDSIRQSIAEGSYEVDAGRIADALIQQEQELA